MQDILEDDLVRISTEEKGETITVTVKSDQFPEGQFFDFDSSGIMYDEVRKSLGLSRDDTVNLIYAGDPVHEKDRDTFADLGMGDNSKLHLIFTLIKGTSSSSWYLKSHRVRSQISLIQLMNHFLEWMSSVRG